MHVAVTVRPAGTVEAQTVHRGLEALSPEASNQARSPQRELTAPAAENDQKVKRTPITGATLLSW